MPELTTEEKLRLLTILLESRHGDLREQNLNRQGKGHFHVSGMGHEALAAISIQMQEDDYIVPFYRDRALVLGRGVSSRQLAIDYFAKAKGESHGRQMPSHYSCAEKHIWSVPTPTGSQLLPACGIAWGIKLDAKNAAVVATVGDAATRQGDFYEAICFAKEKKLPILFVVEDNGYGISSPTRKINPRALDVMQPNDWQELDGANVGEMYEQAAKAFAHIRAGKGPVFFWVMMERLSSHTSSDDQKLYRSAEELKRCEECDPLRKWKEQLIAEGVISESDYAKLDNEIKERIRREFSDAEKEQDPSADELFLEVTGKFPQLNDEVLPPGKYRIGDTVNKTLRLGLERDKRRIIFGEDIEDPKGGVFRLTQKLSTEFPNQVFNSPLAESTILGVACGLGSYGKRPVFELQFIDFIGPGWNLWCISARRKFVAQPGERSSAGALPGAFGGDSLNAGRCRGSVVDGDALRGPGSLFNSETHVLGGTRKRGAGSGDSAWESTKATGWFGRDADCLGQHGGESARGNSTNRKRSEHRAD